MIVFDTETTSLTLPSSASLEAQPSIIEIGAIKLDANYKEIARLSTLVNPGVPFDEAMHATITGITKAQLDQAPTFLAVYPELCAFFLGESTVLAHNVAFDMSVLSFDLHRINAQFAFPWPQRHICTAELSEIKFGKRMKLVDLYEKVMKKKIEQTHRAIDDATALAAVVRKLKPE